MIIFLICIILQSIILKFIMALIQIFQKSYQPVIIIDCLPELFQLISVALELAIPVAGTFL
jgi:hypothetical protein